MLTVNEVISKDPEVLGGTPVFRGTRVLFQALLDYLEGGKRWWSFWMTSLPSAAMPPSLLWNRENCFLSANWDENPPGRMPSPKTQGSFSESRLPNRTEALLAGKKNGELLAIAERQGFEIFLTMDKGLEYEQNLTGRQIAVIILRAKSNRLVDIVPLVEGCLRQLRSIEPRQIARIEE